MPEDDRLLTGTFKEEDRFQEGSLRPANFAEYIGQKNIVENVKVMVRSANMRQRPMDHTLLYGPPGLGKTSLAMIVAAELKTNLHVISGPAVEKKGDLAAILTNIKNRDVVFIDEIHRMHVSIEEILYSAMEDFRLDIVIGQGATARTMKIELRPFTLMGATTRSGLLSNPMRSRFVASLHFDFYETDDLAKIIALNVKKLGLTIEERAIDCIACSSRGTPRIANRIIRRVRDFAVVQGVKNLSKEQVKKSLSMMEIDEHGLDRMDRKILQVIEEYYSGGPVGIEALCATLAEDRLTVEDVFEPYLLKEGFLLRTPRGREITDKARNCLQQG